jgi:predicted dehydrogenase
MSTSRKSFIKKSALGMAGLTIGGMGMTRKSYSRVIGASDRLNLAVVGLGRRVHAWPDAIAHEDNNAHLLYLCDVMKHRRDDAAERFSGVLGYTPALENDVRKIFDDSDVDAVIIATPDHWHTPGTCYAVEAGKHVYVEKPGSHNPRENELMLGYQKKYGKVIQLGNQRRSARLVNQMIQEVHDGVIGEAYMVQTAYAARRGEVPVAEPASIPDGLDWDLFQGPAPRQEYKHDTWDYNWHWYGWTWGTAEAGNNAIHAVDLARWALQVDFPERVDVIAHKHHFPDDGWTMYDTMDASFKFPGGKVIRWDCKSRNGHNTYGTQGPIIFGTEGSVKLSGGEYTVYDRDGDLVKTESLEDETGGSINEAHVSNFMNGIRGKAELNSPVEECLKSTLLCHLANISYRTGKGFDVNTSNGHIFDKEAMKLWGREYEPGWEPEV